MKKLLFLLPFCVAAAAAVEPQTQTVIYKPIEGTTSFEEKGTSNEMREGSWTNKTTGETSTAFFRPTRTVDGKVYEVNDANLHINADTDTVSAGDLNWSWVSIKYKMPKALTLNPGDMLEFSYTIAKPDSHTDLTVSFENENTQKTIVTGSGSAGTGITTSVGRGDFYDEPAVIQELVKATNFKGVITCGEDGQCVLTFGEVVSIGTADETYKIYYTEENLGAFTLNNVVISLDAGLTDITSGNLIAPPALSNLTIKYTTTTPEPATATLSLLALAGIAARRRRK